MTMKLFLPAIFVIGSFFTLPAQASNAAPLATEIPAAQNSPENLIADFYRAWLNINNHDVIETEALRTRYFSQTYLSARLYQQLNDVWYANDENGEPLGPGADYFTRSQDFSADWPANVVAINVATPDDDRFQRTIVSLGKGCTKANFLVTSIQEGHGYKIDSVQELGRFNHDCYQGDKSSRPQEERDFSSARCQSLDKQAIEKQQYVEGEGTLRGDVRVSVYEAPDKTCAIVGSVAPDTSFTGMAWYHGYVYVSYPLDHPGVRFMQNAWLPVSSLQTIQTSRFPDEEDEPYPDVIVLNTIRKALKAIADYHLVDPDEVCLGWRIEKDDAITVLRHGAQMGCQNKRRAEKAQILFSLWVNNETKQIAVSFPGEPEKLWPLTVKNAPKIKYVTGEGRAFISESPGLETENKNEFLIPDDRVLAFQSQNGFDYIYYIDSQFISHSGWIKSERVLQIPLQATEQYFYGDGLIDADLMPVYNGTLWSLNANSDSDMEIWAHSQNIRFTDIRHPDGKSTLYSFDGGQALIEKPDALMTRQLTWAGMQHPEEGYLSTVTFNGLQIRTLRDIGVGDEGQNIIERYGADYIKFGEQCLGYSRFDRVLMFCLDESSRVQSISWFTHMTNEQLKLMQTPLHD